MTTVLQVIHVVNLKAMKKQASMKQSEALNGQGILTICLAILTIGFIMYNVLNVIF
jgi:hypothetical protein